MYKNTYNDLLDRLIAGEESVLLTYLKPIDDKKGEIINKVLLKKKEMENFCQDKEEELCNKIRKSLETGNVQIHHSKEEKIIMEPNFSKPRLVIFGGGHIAEPLCEFGAKVGFSVVVVDDRPFFANSNRFPEASEVICESFEKSFQGLNLNKSDFVVIVTRGHKHDEVCLKNTLKYETAYIGMIGSRRRTRGIREKLISEGYSKEVLEGVNAPIGLDIGALTPEEIAISIISQVIAYRRKATQVEGKRKFNWPEFDNMVIEEMAKEDEMPRALVTIINAKGSVPRKTGAKMIVWPDGRILGSIGGGCSEADVITTARDIISHKGYRIQHVDMTGDVAEDAGMVCGGIIDVLIESF